MFCFHLYILLHQSAYSTVRLNVKCIFIGYLRKCVCRRAAAIVFTFCRPGSSPRFKSGYATVSYVNVEQDSVNRAGEDVSFSSFLHFTKHKLLLPAGRVSPVQLPPAAAGAAQLWPAGCLQSLSRTCNSENKAARAWLHALAALNFYSDEVTTLPLSAARWRSY